MEYYFLDAVSWQHSQALYHAAAHLQREALFILRPATPYVCIGMHQDAQAEIDLDFTGQAGIPVFRREVGGGAVYLDGDQLFFQLILRRDRPDVPRSIAAFYRKFLDPVVQTYREFGVAASYRPVNDIVTQAGRKISGTGAAEIEGMIVLVGNFIVDFDYDAMAHCLKVPDEKFRDKVHKTLYENLTTIQRETGRSPSNAGLAAALSRYYQPLLGPLLPAQPDAALLAKADEIVREMDTPGWLFANDRRRRDLAQVKIAEGVYVTQRMSKTPGGLLRATAVTQQGRLSSVHLSGDFFFFPAERLTDLEQCLEQVEAHEEAIVAAVIQFYDTHAIESPGVRPVDIAALLGPER
jgi:lipoate---protein ligase